MGNTKTTDTLPVVQPPSQESWRTIENLGYCDIVQNISTCQIAEQYTTPLDGRLSLLEEYERYEYRRTQTQNLVSVISVQKQDSKYICSGVDLIKVRTERMPARLSQLQNISVMESYYILQQAMAGFKTICEKVGPIHIDDELICFTVDGKLKVWLNENLAKNSPQQPLRFESVTQKPTESSMIVKLFEIVQQHTADKQLPQSLVQKYQSTSITNFTDAMELLRQSLQQQHIMPPGRIKLHKNSEMSMDSSAQPLHLDVGYGTLKPSNRRFSQVVTHHEMPTLKIPNTPHDYLIQSTIKLFEQSQKAVLTKQNYNVQLQKTGDLSSLNIIPELIVTIAEMVPPSPSEIVHPLQSIIDQPTNQLQQQVNNQTGSANIQCEKQSQRPTSISKQKRNVGTPRKPPLPPSAKENLLASKSIKNLQPQYKPLTAGSPPVTVEQRNANMPVHIVPQQINNKLIDIPIRPSSSHGINVLQMVRSDSAYGAGKTILQSNQTTIIQLPAVVHPTTAQVSHPIIVRNVTGQSHNISNTVRTSSPMIHDAPLVATVPTNINNNNKAPLIEIRSGRISIDTKIVQTQPISLPQSQPQQLKINVLQANTPIKHQTAIVVQQPQGSDGIKRQISVERLKGLINKKQQEVIIGPKPVSPIPQYHAMSNTTLPQRPALSTNTNSLPIISNNNLAVRPPSANKNNIPPVPTITNEIISISPSENSKTLPPTQSAQPPYQAALNFQPGQLISRQPSQSSQSIPSTNENTGNNNINYFSGGIRILNNRMVVPTPQAPAKEPVLK